MSDTTTIVQRTSDFVQQHLRDSEKGHDWHHVSRVLANARQIGAGEDVDMFVVELGALLHDIADAKFHDGDEDIGPQIAGQFLTSEGVSPEVIEHVQNIIRHISFKGNISGQEWMSPELAVVQDADRLDALGAIGIARAFHYGGHTNRALYDPDLQPRAEMTKEEYLRAESTTINHFYEKLLLLKDRMNTDTGRALAEERHQFMERYLTEFLAEWKGER